MRQRTIMQRERENTYNKTLNCFNCGKRNLLNIPIHVFVEDFLKERSFICGYCECDILGKGNREKDK